MKFVFIVYSYL